MTHMLDRLLLTRILASRASVLLLGPRQVGKSTLCRRLGADLYVDLADEAEFLSFAKDPSRLRREVEALGKKGLVVIDEIQRVPSLLNTVQSLVDVSDRKYRFVLTGSSATKLKRGGANLLPGRMIMERMDPLSVLEIEGKFELERALRIGMLPGIFHGGSDATELLGTYAEVYLREEILAQAATRNIGAYARFLDAVAAMSGQWINYSKLASDTEIPKETIRRYVQVLEDTMIAIRLLPFDPRVRTTRRVSQRERILLFDVGVRNALCGLHQRPVSQVDLGAVFEQWLIQQVVVLHHALHKEWRLSAYRTEGGAEVDLVIERGDDIVGLGIKAGTKVGPTDTRGLQSLAEMVGGKVRLSKWIAYQGTRVQRFPDGTEALPWREVLVRLRG